MNVYICFIILLLSLVSNHYCDTSNRSTAGVRLDPGLTRSRRGRHDRRLEVAKSTPIGVGFSVIDSIGHALSRKTYSDDTGPIVLRLGTISRDNSSARPGHLTASRLASSLSLIPSGLAPSLALALARLGAHSAHHGSCDLVKLR
jgi:hypothetical protein